MLGNYEEKIAGAQEIFNQILKSVSGELQNKEIHEVEEELFRTVLKIGHSLLGAYLEKKVPEKILKRIFHITRQKTGISRFLEI